MNLKVIGMIVAIVSASVIIFVYPFAHENLTALTGIRFTAALFFLAGVGMIAAHFEAKRPRLHVIKGTRVL